MHNHKQKHKQTNIAVVDCELPNKELYKFEGRITFNAGKKQTKSLSPTQSKIKKKEMNEINN